MPAQRSRATRARLLTSGRRLLATVLVLTVLAACAPARQTSPGPGPSVSTVPSPTVSASPSPSPSPTPTPEPTPEPLGDGPVTFLLIGTDSRDPSDLTGNADTIMVVHLPADREEAYLVSFTRDMWVAIPGVGEGKINSAFARGGTETLRATVSTLLQGTEIDYVVQSNFAGFIAITRWLGGFEVENKHHSTVTVQSTGRVVDFPQGRIRLENTDGLIYVRERKRLPLGDLDRAERQRAALVGMMTEVKKSLDDPVAYAELAAALYGNVKVTGELGVEDVIALRPLLRELTAEDVVSLMAPITGFGTIGGASVNLVDHAQMAALGEAMRSDTMDHYVATYGTDYAP